MSVEGGAAASAAAAAMVSDEDIAQALVSVLRDANPSEPLSLDGVVQKLQFNLGSDLSHKMDFIRAQIHHFLRPPPPPPALHSHPQLHFHQKDRFAPYPHSNFPPIHPSQLPPEYAAHFPQNYGFRPLHPPPPPMLVSNSEPFPSSAASTAVPHAHEVAPAPEPPKDSTQTGRKRRGGPGGLNKLCGVSPELQTIVGEAKMPRTEIVKQLWAYIRKHNLQDPNNKRKIICNDELRLVFETDCTDMFKMNKLLAKHITRLEPSVQILQNTKRIKTDEETGSRTDESVQIVIISEALANFFGTSEREMSQAEVLRQVWEYIKVNQLEDPINSMAIQCDAKLQQLLGCESISALGVPEMLARHHLSKRS
ncbi:uncharacterized protein LOC116011411 isoform X2 [Ipomoea triloba]|uniref:uncharacterized protein LOC116011411 isoform X2 n=1 Tax=Ipomoea triloba TaxID=35885 RepID=UPI00125CD56E|nr:uncharacterized protein LOC116011411 isoform X2 [Ipomoea triloba]